MRLPLALIGAFWLALFGAASAHDHWISRGGYVSPIDGSHCCGVSDCAPVDADDVHAIQNGYALRGLVIYGVGAGALNQWVDETVPQAEVQPSRDGHWWRCRKPNGERRCIFGPPPSL